VAARGARAAGGDAGDRVLEVALQPIVSARLAVSIVVIAINRSRASLARSAATSRVWSIANRNWPQSKSSRLFQIDERSKFQTQKGLIFGLV
jgi:hypothetical protein